MKEFPSFNIITEIAEDEKNYIVEKLINKVKDKLNYESCNGFYKIDYHRLIENEIIKYEVNIEYNKDENKYDCICTIYDFTFD